MKHSRESKAKLELFWVRPSQPPSRGGRTVFARICCPESTEVKGVCLESEPQPRKSMKYLDGYPMRIGAAYMGWCAIDECQLRSSGVTDSIEVDRGYVATRRRVGFLGDELPEYRVATSPGSRRDDPPLGMGSGLAMKRCNSRRAKVPTSQHPWTGKHGHYPGSEI